MPRRQGAADGNDAQVLRQFMDMLHRGMQHRPQGERGRSDSRGRDAEPRRRGERPAGGGSGARTSDGDWRCGSCGFFPNFQRRGRCFECGRPRATHRQAGMGGSGGGVTSPALRPGGLRPQNAVAAAASKDAPPSFRVPGASLAAKATYAQAAAGAAGNAASATKPAGRKTGGTADTASSLASNSSGSASTDKDADGFQVVRHGRARRQHGSATGGGDAAMEDVHMEEVSATLQDGARGAEDGGDEDADDADAPEEGQPDPAQLRRRWNDEVALVKRLARQGMDQRHPAMVAAVAARDAAEQKWRLHKDPTPLATRLGWAQRRFDKAIALQTRTKERLAELEQEYERQKTELMVKLDADTARTAKRKKELAEIQDEASGERPQPRTGDGGEEVRRACAKTCEDMRKHVAPGLTLLAEQLESGTEAWTMLTAIVSTLNTAHDELQRAVDSADTGAQRFDIGEEDDAASVWSESHDLAAGAAEGECSSAAASMGATTAARVEGNIGAQGAGAEADWRKQRQHQLRQQAQQQSQQEQWWQRQHWQWQQQQQQYEMQQAQANGFADNVPRGELPWAPCANGGQESHTGDASMGEEAWGQWGSDAWHSGATWRQCGHGKWQKSSWADAWESEQLGGDDAMLTNGDADEPCRKNRRLGGTTDGEQPPTQQQRQQDGDGPAAAAGAAATPAEAERAHAEMLSCVIARAVAAGIQPVTMAGEDLQMLGRDQLLAWAAENLPSE